ncbi:hypothetical protein SOVF_078790 [Spinacia oleracea]|nr:hypothetical protein SOVF_078790 [Spinacia oleracea]
MSSMMMIGSFGLPLTAACSFAQPHGVAHHQIIAGQPIFSGSLIISSSSSSTHPVINYWPGSYRLDEGSVYPYAAAARITNQVQGDINYGAVQQLEKGSSPKELRPLRVPDLNLDPPL